MDRAHQKGGEGANGRDATNRGIHHQPRPTCLGLIRWSLAPATDSRRGKRISPIFAIRAKIDAVLSGRAALRQTARPEAADGAPNGSLCAVSLSRAGSWLLVHGSCSCGTHGCACGGRAPALSWIACEQMK